MMLNSEEAPAPVSVVIRVRPLTPAELRAGEQPEWEHTGDEIWQPNSRQLNGSARLAFDRVFGAEASTRQIYEEVVATKVERVLAGYNATVLAYGQTCSGKTSTIRGSADSGEGLIPLCTRQVLSHVAAARRGAGGDEWGVSLSYLEVYQESVTDLLTGQAGLNVYETREGACVVDGLSAEGVRTWADAERLLSRTQ